MSEYYAVQRSTDHLAHYGVKGMKWGVRKAIASGNEKALDRHFRKAAKKLKKLSDDTNLEQQSREKSYHYGSARGHAVGGLAAASIAGIANALNKTHGIASKMLPIGAGIGAVNAVYHAVKGNNARRKLSGKGHEKAVAKRNAWEKEMRVAFKGTKYANQIGVTNNKKQSKNSRLRSHK